MGAIYQPTLCKQFAQSMRGLPSYYSVDSLEPVIEALYFNATLSALREVDEVVKSDRSMDSDLRRRIDKLRISHEAMLYDKQQRTISPDDNVQHCKQLFKPDNKLEYRVKVYHPEKESTPQTLLNAIGRVGTCVIDFGNLSDEPEDRREEMKGFKKPAEKMYRDTLAGGSCYTFVQTRQKGKRWKDTAFTRLLVTLDDGQNPLLFYDTVENGNLNTCDMQGWINDGKAYGLLLSIASSIAIAGKLKLGRLAVGEVEAKNFARELGIQQQHIFNGNKRKIGYPPDQESIRGPYCYTFTNDHNETYVFDVPKVIAPLSVDYFVQRAKVVCDLVEKKKKFPPEKKIDLATFFDFASAYIGKRKADKALVKRIKRVREKFGLQTMPSEVK